MPYVVRAGLPASGRGFPSTGLDEAGGSRQYPSGGARRDALTSVAARLHAVAAGREPIRPVRADGGHVVERTARAQMELKAPP